MSCRKVLSFPQFSGSAPAPGPPGTRTAAEEETASALLPRSLRFLKKEMKFLLTNEGEALAAVVAPEKTGKPRVPFFWRSGIALLGSCGVAFVRSLPIIPYCLPRRAKSQVVIAAIQFQVFISS